MTCGDNFHFDITGAPLEVALQVAFSDHKRAIGWTEQAAGDPSVSPGGVWGANRSHRRMVLYWYIGRQPGIHSFPGGLDHEGVLPLVRAWLAEADYGDEPDHDGSNRKGCRVYNEAWGMIGDDSAAFVAIEPAWVLLGK